MPVKLKQIACIAVATALWSSAGAAETKIERGQYLASIMDCTGCHTPGALAGKPDLDRYLGGSDIGFQIPGVGIFYPPNLTPDTATGLGSWSAEEIVSAIRSGVRPDGRALVPVMPFPSYAALTDEDADALVAFLKGLPAVSHQAPAPVLGDAKPTAPYLAPTMPQ